MKTEDALDELKEIVAITLKEEQEIRKVLEGLWKSAQSGAIVAGVVDRADFRATRYTVPNV
jgi:hypothetical protein